MRLRMPFAGWRVGMGHLCGRFGGVHHIEFAMLHTGPCPLLLWIHATFSCGATPCLELPMFAATPCYPQGLVPYLGGPMPRQSVGLHQGFSYTMSPAGLCPLFMWAYVPLSFWDTLGSEIYVGPCRILVLGCLMF